MEDTEVRDEHTLGWQWEPSTNDGGWPVDYALNVDSVETYRGTGTFDIKEDTVPGQTYVATVTAHNEIGS